MPYYKEKSKIKNTKWVETKTYIEDPESKRETCHGFTKKGEPCQNYSLPDQPFCHLHAPTKGIQMKRDLETNEWMFVCPFCNGQVNPTDKVCSGCRAIFNPKNQDEPFEVDKIDPRSFSQFPQGIPIEDPSRNQLREEIQYKLKKHRSVSIGERLEKQWNAIGDWWDDHKASIVFIVLFGFLISVNVHFGYSWYLTDESFKTNYKPYLDVQSVSNPLLIADGLEQSLMLLNQQNITTSSSGYQMYKDDLISIMTEAKQFILYYYDNNASIDKSQIFDNILANYVEDIADSIENIENTIINSWFIMILLDLLGFVVILCIIASI